MSLLACKCKHSAKCSSFHAWVGAKPMKLMFVLCCGQSSSPDHLSCRKAIFDWWAQSMLILLNFSGWFQLNTHNSENRSRFLLKMAKMLAPWLAALSQWQLWTLAWSGRHRLGKSRGCFKGLQAQRMTSTHLVLTFMTQRILGAVLEACKTKRMTKPATKLETPQRKIICHCRLWRHKTQASLLWPLGPSANNGNPVQDQCKWQQQREWEPKCKQWWSGHCQQQLWVLVVTLLSQMCGHSCWHCQWAALFANNTKH